jgi:hypothetical protein
LRGYLIGLACIAVVALPLTVLSSAIHGSHAGARLAGPSGWTSWVVLDCALVVAPVAVPVAVLAVRRAGGRSIRLSLMSAAVVWLVVATLSLALVWSGYDFLLGVWSVGS